MNRYNHLGIYLIVVLVMSITPATAVQINSSLNSNITDDVDRLGGDKSKLTNDLSQLNTTLNRIKTDQKRIDDARNDMNHCHWWSWCYYAARYACVWVENIANIVGECPTLSSQTDQLSSSSNKLNETNSDLKGLMSYDDSNNVGIENSSEMGAATAMKDQFKSRNIFVNIASVDVNNLTNGTNADIIQYKTTDGQYRYLKYITKHRDSIEFEGAYGIHKVLNESDVVANTQLKLTVNNTTKSSRLVNIAYQIEKTQINDNIANINQSIKEKKADRSYAEFIGIIGGIIGGVGFAIEVTGTVITTVSSAIIAALAPTPGCVAIPFLWGALKVGIVLICLAWFLIHAGEGMALYCGIMILMCDHDLSDLNKELGKLNDILADLNSYSSSDLVSPVAGNMTFTTHEGRAVNSTLNGTDVYDDPITYGVSLKAEHGDINVDGNGSFFYKADPGFKGNDTFTYTVHDDELNLTSDIGTVAVEVQPDQAPVVENKDFYMASNSEFNGTLNGTDPDGDNITFMTVLQPLHGNLTLTDDGKFVYVPNENYVGNDSFTFKTNDGVLDSQNGTVTIHIVNETTPLASNMVFDIPHDTQLNNEFNVSGINDTKIFTIDSPPKHGNITLSGLNFTYQPVKGYNGEDEFTYHFADVLGHISNTASVKICMASSPTAKSMTFNSLVNNKLVASFNVTGNDLSIKLLNAPKHGNITLGNGSFTYKPNKDYIGMDTFTYQLIDALGQESNSENITINVTKKPVKIQTKNLPTKNGNINHNTKLSGLSGLDVGADDPELPKISNISSNDSTSHLLDDLNPLELIKNMQNTVTQWFSNIQGTVTEWIKNTKTTVNNLFK